MYISNEDKYQKFPSKIFTYLAMMNENERSLLRIAKISGHCFDAEFYFQSSAISNFMIEVSFVLSFYGWLQVHVEPQ
jgi:hypothetical protein